MKISTGSLSDLEVFHIYKWLLEEEKHDVLSQWTKKVLEKNARQTDSSASASGSGMVESIAGHIDLVCDCLLYLCKFKVSTE